MQRNRAVTRRYLTRGTRWKRTRAGAATSWTGRNGIDLGGRCGLRGKFTRCPRLTRNVREAEQGGSAASQLSSLRLCRRSLTQTTAARPIESFTASPARVSAKVRPGLEHGGTHHFSFGGEQTQPGLSVRFPGHLYTSRFRARQSTASAVGPRFGGTRRDEEPRGAGCAVVAGASRSGAEQTRL